MKVQVLGSAQLFFEDSNLGMSARAAEKDWPARAQPRYHLFHLCLNTQAQIDSEHAKKVMTLSTKIGPCNLAYGL